MAGKPRAGEESESEQRRQRRVRMMMMRMMMKQILVLGLFFVPCHMRCFSNSTELIQVANKRLSGHFPWPPEPVPDANQDAPASCPVELYQQQPLPAGLKHRSLSPWRYVVVSLPDHFPPTYVQAQCLCTGCILFRSDGTAVESDDYNSAPVRQSRVFLRRELCEDGRSHRLKPVNVEVTVGCTCARYESELS